MKFIKYSLILFAIAVITDLTLISAYSAPVSQVLYYDIPRGDTIVSSYYTKNYSAVVPQYYENTETWTALTDPCSDCRIVASVKNERQDKLFTVNSITMGHLKSFGSGSSSLDNYNAHIYRSDGTLLTTSHIGVWYINTANNMATY